MKSCNQATCSHAAMSWDLFSHLECSTEAPLLAPSNVVGSIRRLFDDIPSLGRVYQSTRHG